MASSPASSRKPRRKRKGDAPSNTNSNVGAAQPGPKKRSLEPEFPLVAFLWPAKGTVSSWVLLPVILMVVGLFRWTTSLWNYSGFQTPPMHGDFEAQRHWMEITIHLPISRWYFHDLEWWGLDYPPLTAYHSWLVGKIGSFIDPSWFALDVSRRLDDPALKVFMRASAFISEYLVYIPAVVVFLRKYSRIEAVKAWDGWIALVAILMQPATILIDHGHFQYNTVMLGLFAAGMSSLLAGRPLWGCVFFVGALGFKQMALFYAPAVFAYLLGICVVPKIRLARLVSIAVITVVSFALVYTPFLLGVLFEWWNATSVDELPAPPLLSALPVQLNEKAWYYPLILQLAQSIYRIFPFARGLFEDKVANFWCAIHTFHKLHRYSGPAIQRAALLATSASIIPPCLVVFLRPRRELLPLAFAATSWGFFLFSYQVHEKNVLLPLLPMTFLLGGQGGLLPSTRAWVGFANILGCWTMFPLLKRDQLRVPYTVLTLLWAYLLGLPPTSLSAYSSDVSGGLRLPTKLIHLSAYLAMLAWHAAEAFVAPPIDKPDLWVVANVLLGAGGFGLCYLWCVWNLLWRSRLLDLLWRQSDAKAKPEAQ